MNNNFSENLKKIRKDNNYSQEQLAEELGVSRQAISKWESSISYPEMDKIIALCTKFNLNIDDLLYKDIREVKGEEIAKKNINNFIDDFLKFITDTINMFSSMTFKSKIKCLFEQGIIAFILFLIFMLIGGVFSNILAGVFSIIPNYVYFILKSIIKLIYSLFGIGISLMIILHIFKIRYLDYYKEFIMKDIASDNNMCDEVNKIKDNNRGKFSLKKENKIIIRNSSDHEYKFINSIFKSLVVIIKFFVLCFSSILFIGLITLFIGFVFSFLIIKTGIFFLGLLITILSIAIIDIILILLLLNFVFNRKSDIKKMIYFFVSSLITTGIGIGLILIGTLNFEYIKNDKSMLETNYIDLDMRSDLVIGDTYDVEYIISDNNNLKIEYSICKYCDINMPDLDNSVLYLWGSCDNPFKLIKAIISEFNDKKITSIDSELHDIKVYTTKENIELLKKNYDDYITNRKEEENIINYYEGRINELNEKIDEYILNENKYNEEISTLKEELNRYKDN